jgi:ubiquinone/menaquinone biosynthesis C-methylase UbiE
MATPLETYDRIAEHFSATREHPWPEIEEFLEGRHGEVALDLGCGNGRHAELLASRVDCVIGLDASRGLLNQARARATDRAFPVALVQGDAGEIPIENDVVDLAVYVAVLHHLSPRSARLRSLDEFARVLGPDGRGLVSVWSTEHENFDREEGFDTTVDWTLPNGETVPRYYHIYDPSEFRADLADSDLRVFDTFVATGNCYAVVGSD